MKHLHTSTGTTYEVGRLFDTDGKTYDINIITKWDEEHDFEQNPVLVDYYFGDLEDAVTNSCIDEFIERQQQIRNSIKYLERLKLMDPTVTDIGTTINCLKSMIVDLH